jgi:Zn ribbon nucleic-acid-binding protein
MTECGNCGYAGEREFKTEGVGAICPVCGFETLNSRDDIRRRMEREEAMLRTVVGASSSLGESCEFLLAGVRKIIEAQDDNWQKRFNNAK